MLKEIYNTLPFPPEAYMALSLVLFFILVVVLFSFLKNKIDYTEIIEAKTKYIEKLERKSSPVPENISGQEILRLKRENGVLQEKVNKMLVEHQMLQTRLSDITTRYNAISERFDRATKVPENISGQEILRVKRENGVLQEKVNKMLAEHQMLQTQLSDITTRYNAISERFDRATKAYIELRSALRKERHVCSELKEKLGQAESSRDKIKTELDIQKSELEEIKRQYEDSKDAISQLHEIFQLYPDLKDLMEDKESDLSEAKHKKRSVQDRLPQEIWNTLTDEEKDQIELDRYVESRRKSRWQIGRDYELAVAFEYREKGYKVDTYGSRKGLSDLGRDLIAKTFGKTLIIQCKYWSKQKTIHEKHIFQLYGTLITYKLENPDLPGEINGVFVTNTTLSDMAHRVANLLNISILEHHEMVDFPRIKCNIGHDDFGVTYIYHLPMDAQYDIVQIKNPGEFYAFTVQEAVSAGFRRTYKWHGQKPI